MTSGALEHQARLVEAKAGGPAAPPSPAPSALVPRQSPQPSFRPVARATPTAFRPQVEKSIRHALAPEPALTPPTVLAAPMPAAPVPVVGRTDTLPTITQLRERSDGVAASSSSSASSTSAADSMSPSGDDVEAARQRGRQQALDEAGRSAGPSDDSDEEQVVELTKATDHDTAHDRAWLETHARALYPLIRAELRSELLRDRERRGRLVREQR